MKRIIVGAIVFFIILSSFQSATQPGITSSIERGKKVYESICLACHQADGGGVQRMNPPLIKTKWVLGNKKALSRIVLTGLKGGEIEIDGDKFENPMPPQAAALTDQQIADVLTFVRNNFGNKASAVLPADVKAARTAVKPVSKVQVKKTVLKTKVKKSA